MKHSFCTCLATLIVCGLIVLNSLGMNASWAESPEAKEHRRALVWQAKRILFLGDSITASGQYIANFETWLLTQKLPNVPMVIDGGLSSETVSGLSEEGHAGGKFPRPHLMERLDRLLAIAKPDLVFACYGINCGIYAPFAPERFQSYQQGMKLLKNKVEQAGAKLILITPPTFDDHRAKKSFSYNGVLDQYSDWLLEQRTAGWNVIDLHHAMTQALKERRQQQPDFTFQPDNVHPNAAGHWFITQRLCTALGDNSIAELASVEDLLDKHLLSSELLPVVQKRMQLLRDAYVGAAGHLRPGVAKGLPLPEADNQAAELTAKLNKLIEK